MDLVVVLDDWVSDGEPDRVIAGFILDLLSVGILSLDEVRELEGLPA